MARLAAEAAVGRVLLAALVVVCVGCAGQTAGKKLAVTPPAPTSWVTDHRILLSTETRKSLDAQLQAYQESSKHHVLVYITDTTNTFGGVPEAHAEFCPRVFNAWGIGRDGHDDGVVLFVFVKDDVRWITVGYGLEAALPDREATRIAREIVARGIRAGQPDTAVTDGVTAILAAIDAWETKP